MSERIIVKLGGSLLSPYEFAENRLKSGKIPFDIQYALSLLEIVKNSTKTYVFIVGGGYLNRWILGQMNTEPAFQDSPVNDRHHVGIASGIINATLFHALAVSVLGEDQVYDEVLKYHDYDQLDQLSKELSQKKMIIASGRKPGFSHDVDALYFAKLFGTNQVLTLKNVDGIYTADPHKDPTAVKRKVLTWAEYRSIIHVNSHEPGASFPIDAVAAQLAEKMNIGFTVIDGRDFDAVKESFETHLTSKGSVISPTFS